jgi:UDP-N-acetylmuramate: L-alanyl-gamma-D-glutamyl-meso-diaminopimelate ligase
MRIHLLGIGGTGMASLAGMLKESGHEVTGSDQGIYPPMSHILEELGISVRCPYDEKNLNPTPDLVIIGNVISRGNPEAEAVLAREIPYESMPEAIRKFFLPEKRPLVVAGTHGKTTITSLLAWVLELAGKDPSFFVGGNPKNFPRNFQEILNWGEGSTLSWKATSTTPLFSIRGPSLSITNRSRSY